MLTGRPRAPPPSRLVKPQERGKHPVLDAIWRAKWPIAASSAVASLMVICVLILVALEIAHLAKGTDTNLYGTTSVTGAGFWCGFTLLLAAFFIFMINCMVRTRVWASIALAFTIIAGAASIALIVLNAIAVKDGQTDGEKADKTKLIAAQLAFGIIELLLCIDYLVIYTVVGIVASTMPHD